VDTARRPGRLRRPACSETLRGDNGRAHDRAPKRGCAPPEPWIPGTMPHPYQDQPDGKGEDEREGRNPRRLVSLLRRRRGNLAGFHRGAAYGLVGELRMCGLANPDRLQGYPMSHEDVRGTGVTSPGCALAGGHGTRAVGA
jgi:hypothetical protein